MHIGLTWFEDMKKNSEKVFNMIFQETFTKRKDNFLNNAKFIDNHISLTTKEVSEKETNISSWLDVLINFINDF